MQPWLLKRKRNCNPILWSCEPIWCPDPRKELGKHKLKFPSDLSWRWRDGAKANPT